MDNAGELIIEEDSPQRTPKERMVNLLDQVEKHVERFRREALRLEEERDTLLTTLDTIRNSDLMGELEETEKDDVLYYTESLTSRCLTVDVMVKTNRDKMQEDALHDVNRFIDNLVINLRGDPHGTKSRCVMYMNACSSHTQGATDKNFETAILGCTLDDQKRIKKRLQGLLDYIEETSD